MSTQPKHVPFLMSTLMVQAIRAGRKTQTRRIITPQPDDKGLHDHTRFPMAMNSDLEGWWGTVDETGEDRRFKPKCEVGNLIWVREAFCNLHKNHIITVPHVYLANMDAEAEDIRQEYIKAGYDYRWKPSIHMPKAAARIWLRCTGVKAERVQDISEEDAIAEGITPLAMSRMQIIQMGQQYLNYGVKPQLFNDGLPPKESFRSLWQSIHSDPPKPGKPDGRWDANPWVWAYSFEVVSTNGKPENI